MSARPSTSTLFPYTTLFRSEHKVGRDLPCPGVACGRTRQRIEGAVHLDGPQARRQVFELARVGQASGIEVATPGRIQDRKSTRLNSSHRCNSYAVFCLKK